MAGRGNAVQIAPTGGTRPLFEAPLPPFNNLNIALPVMVEMLKRGIPFVGAPILIVAQRTIRERVTPRG